MLKDLGLLILRVGTGVTMAAHGYPKLFGGPQKKPPQPVSKAMGENYESAFEEGGPDNFASTLKTMDVPMPYTAAYASGAAELVGGLALLLGFQTRLAALLILLNLGVAIRKAHWKVGFYGEGGYEYPMALGQSALTLLLTGPGRFAIDGDARTQERTLGARSQKQIDKLQRQSEKRMKRLQKQTGHSLAALQAMSVQELERLQKLSGREAKKLRKLLQNQSSHGLSRLQETSEQGLAKLHEASEHGLEKIQQRSGRGFDELQRRSSRGFGRLRDLVPAGH